MARIIDPMAAPETGAFRANRVSNTAEADRMMSRWADILRDHLGKVHQAPKADTCLSASLRVRLLWC